MREIKFRAWDKLSNRMITPRGGDFIAWHAMSNWKDCLNVMQYTGLVDCNDVEIYEGDIVDESSGRHTWRHIVSSIDGFGSNLYAVEICNNLTTEITDNGRRYYTYEWQKVESGSRRREIVGSDSNTVHSFTVIGNIHENQELLEVEG